jgi:hypothetical protein
LGLGSRFVSGSVGGVWGATWGRKESPTLRGECRGVGGVFEGHGVPSIVGSDPVKNQERACKVHLIPLGKPHEGRPSIKDVNRMIKNL